MTPRRITSMPRPTLGLGSLRSSTSLPLVAAAATAACVTYTCTLHKHYDGRDISNDEIVQSHKFLAGLSPPSSPSSLSMSSSSSSHDYPQKHSNVKLQKEEEWQRRRQRRQHHLKNLTSGGGVTVLPGILNQNDLKVWNKNLQESFGGVTPTIHTATTTTTTTSSESASASSTNETDSTHNKKNSNKIRVNRGRLHSHQESRRDPYNSHFLDLIQSMPELQSLVHSYFDQCSTNTGTGTSMGTNTVGATGKATGYRLTQVQFLLAKPGSQHQIWHRDNIAPGLTMLIALKDIRGNGPTELILGSHLDGYRIVSSSSHNNSSSNVSDDDGGGGGGRGRRRDHDLHNNHKNNGEIILGCLAAGDAILYDARVIHRGRGFGRVRKSSEHRQRQRFGSGSDGDGDGGGGGDSGSDSVEEEKDDEEEELQEYEDRPVLILRWDSIMTPPPGMGLIVTNIIDHVGSLRSLVAWLREGARGNPGTKD